MMARAGKTLQLVTSIAFGGPDLRNLLRGFARYESPADVPLAGTGLADAALEVRNGASSRRIRLQIYP